MAVPLRSWAAADSVGARWSTYREFPPAHDVAGAVACTWHGRAGWARSLRVLPDGCADLVWDGTDLTVVTTGGAPMRWWLSATASTVGLRLRCGCAGSVLGVPMSELPAGRTPLADLWGDAARRTADELASSNDERRVLESLVTQRLFAGIESNPLLFAAVRRLRAADPRISRLADDLGISERGLRRRLQDEVGCSPKRLHRILRFGEFLRRMPEVALGRTSLAVAAADLGYADQSHLGRECRSLAGSSPAAIIRSWARQDGVAEMFQTGPR